MNRARFRLLMCLLCLIGICLPLSVAHADVTALRKGDSGEAVLRLQVVLKEKGFFGAAPTGLYGDITVASVKSFQRAHHLTVDGIAGRQTLTALYKVETVSRGERMPRDEDMLWLARIIHAEAQGEPYAGMVAVGNVVMNRVASPLFPARVRDVVFQYTNGIPQFSPVAEGSIINNPSAECVLAAWDAYLKLRNEVGDCMYFFNPKKAAGSWMVNNCEFYARIGNHDFYR